MLSESIKGIPTVKGSFVLSMPETSFGRASWIKIGIEREFDWAWEREGEKEVERK